MSSDTKYFDLKYVHDCFNTALLEEDDVDLGLYLNAYKELRKFCELMGSVFGFVATEISSKSETLEELKSKNQNENFKTLKNMIKYEMESKLLKKSDYISGCRTLLRLHRGLDFIRVFLKRISEMEDHESTSSMGREVYYNTLGQFHPWLLRQGAYIAMCMLPTRETLLHQVCGDRMDSSLAILPSMLEVTNQVYHRTETCFKNNKLLNLP